MYDYPRWSGRFIRKIHRDHGTHTPVKISGVFNQYKSQPNASVRKLASGFPER
jgi:hypothetical protein